MKKQDLLPHLVWCVFHMILLAIFLDSAIRYGYLGSAFGTGLGAVMGTSPAESLVVIVALSPLSLERFGVFKVIIHNESAAGVQEGGRTGTLPQMKVKHPHWCNMTRQFSTRFQVCPQHSVGGSDSGTVLH